MLFTIGIGALILGLVAGSAITVIASDPYARDWLVRKRSRCDSCGTNIRIIDLVPIVSFVMLRGRCRTCKQPIPRWHIGVEILTAGTFLAAVLLRPDLSIPELFMLLLVLGLLIALSVVDIRFWTLPNILVGTLVVVALIHSMVFETVSLAEGVVGAVLGLMLLGSISLISGGRSMGWGDVKLTGALGLLLGWQHLLFALAISFVAGGIVGIVLLSIGKATRKSHIQFGPFLAFGAIVILMFPKLFTQVLAFTGGIV